MDKKSYQRIVMSGSLWTYEFVPFLQTYFHSVQDIFCNLRRKNSKIIRGHDENHSQQKIPAVFPEIFVDRLKGTQGVSILKGTYNDL